jgi:hypothetical protein
MKLKTSALRKREKRLEEENKRLRRQVTQLSNELDHLKGGFYASKGRHTFHRKNCKWAAFIIQSPKRLIEFSSHQEAIDAGYKPCKTCRA